LADGVRWAPPPSHPLQISVSGSWFLFSDSLVAQNKCHYCNQTISALLSSYD
jgi:hypothetical protein